MTIILSVGTISTSNRLSIALTKRLQSAKGLVLQCCSAADGAYAHILGVSKACKRHLRPGSTSSSSLVSALSQLQLIDTCTEFRFLGG
jgi:hypothetical protein